MPYTPDYGAFYRVRSMMEQLPGGMQMFQQTLSQLNRQLGLQQRRERMMGEQMNIPPHLRFGFLQQSYPELYGRYAGGVTQAAMQAPQINLQRAQAIAGIQGQIESLRQVQEQIRLQEEQIKLQEEAQRTNFWDILGTVGGLGIGVAGLLFPPALPATMGLGMGAAVQRGWQAGGYARPSTWPSYLEPWG